jgi:hypothetical protein
MVVVALGTRPDRRLANRLKRAGIEFCAVGDCSGIGRLAKAVKEGFQAGMAL